MFLEQHPLRLCCSLTDCHYVFANTLTFVGSVAHRTILCHALDTHTIELMMHAQCIGRTHCRAHVACTVYGSHTLLSSRCMNIITSRPGRLVRWAAFKERVFSSGIEPSLRQLAWKFLLGVYPHDSTRQERAALLSKKVREYERMRAQWQTLNEEQASR